MPGTPHPTHGLRRPSQPTSPTPSDPRFHLGSSLVDGESIGSGSASGSHGHAQHPLMLRSASSSASTSSLLERALLSAGSYVGGGVSRMLGSGNNSPNDGSDASSGGGLGHDGGPGSHPLKHGWNSAGEESDENDADSREGGRSSSDEVDTRLSSERTALSPTSGGAVSRPSLERKTSSSSRRAAASVGSASVPGPASPTPAGNDSRRPSSSIGDDDRRSLTDSQSGPSMLSVGSTPAHSQPSTSTASLSTTTAPTTTSSGTVGGGGKASSSAASDAGGGSASAAESTTTGGSEPPVRAGLKGMAQAARQAKAASAQGQQTGVLGANEHGIDTLCIEANDLDVDAAGGLDGEGSDHPLSERSLDRRGYHSFLCLGRPFHVEKRWKLVRGTSLLLHWLIVIVKAT